MMLNCYLQSLTVYEIKTEDVYKDVFEDKSLFDFSDYIKTEDVYKDVFEAKSLFEFSDYPRDSKFYDPVNIKLLLKWKMSSKEK